MPRRLGYTVAHINILAVCAVLLSAFAVQFLGRELPCPLCVLQRMAMLLCALGPAYILLRSRSGTIEPQDLATGYGLSVVAAVAGAMIAARQVLLHIVPPDPGFGEPVLGLHLYTWSLVVFGVVLVVSGLNLIFTKEMLAHGMAATRTTTFVLGLLAAVILANAIAVFFEEGLHWTLPDNPTHYQLLDHLTRLPKRADRAGLLIRKRHGTADCKNAKWARLRAWILALNETKPDESSGRVLYAV